MREFPEITVLKEAILKEHSEEDLNNVLRQLKKKYVSPKSRKRVDILLNTKELTSAHNYLVLILVAVCDVLKVKIPHVYIHYPDRRTPEQVERAKKDKEARFRARPPIINYEEEISKIREKNQMYIHNLQEKGDKNGIKRTKEEEFREIIDLYLARLMEPHKHTDEDGGRPHYVVWSLSEISHELVYIRNLPSEFNWDYQSLIRSYSKRHLKGESLDYQAIAAEIFRFFSEKTEGCESRIDYRTYYNR